VKSSPISNQPVSGNVIREGDKNNKTAPERADFDRADITMRRLENYIRKYGPEFGPVLYHVIPSQAAHAGVSARLRRKLDVTSGKTPATPRKPSASEYLPLFREVEAANETEVPEIAAPVGIGD
jgi:hypothetical protein